MRHPHKTFVRNSYSQDAKAYRESWDEEAIKSIAGQTYQKHLTEICKTFNHKIDTLDLGCGTGRYFHCLKNIRRLVGIDLSEEMLAQAKNPIEKSKCDIDRIDLLTADLDGIDKIFSNHFKFDFIYSIGTLALVTELNTKLLDKIYNLLKVKGKAYITTLNKDLTPQKTFLNLYLNMLRLFGIKNRIQLHSKYSLKRKDLELILKNSQFKNYTFDFISDKNYCCDIVFLEKD